MTAEDFKEPRGQLLTDFFPVTEEERSAGKTADHKLKAHVTQWIVQAAAKTSNTEAQAHWVYYLAYSAIHARMVVLPSQVELDEHSSVQWSSHQLQAIADLRDVHRNSYESFVSEQIERFPVIRTRR